VGQTRSKTNQCHMRESVHKSVGHPEWYCYTKDTCQVESEKKTSHGWPCLYRSLQRLQDLLLSPLDTVVPRRHMRHNLCGIRIQILLHLNGREKLRATYIMKPFPISEFFYYIRLSKLLHVFERNSSPRRTYTVTYYTVSCSDT